MKYNYLIVGSGLFGSVFANQCKEKGKTCLIIDKRTHIGGNCYSEKIEGIDTSLYGPHIFCTNNEEVWHYAQLFSKFTQYAHRVKVNYHDKIYSMPINLQTLYELHGIITPCEAQHWLKSVQIPIVNPKNLEEWCLAQVGSQLYEMFIKHYTTKQWGKEPKNLPASIIKRLPIRLTYDDRWHQTRFSGIPTTGYTQWIANMVAGIKIELGVDFFNLNWKEYAQNIIYTGPIDQLFSYCYGKLDYRTLRFDTKVLDGDYQGVAQMNYTDEITPFTRITEHKHFTFKESAKTVVTWEYPETWKEGSEPFYPINDEKNNQIYQKYKDLLVNEPAITVGGRLGSYKYIQMDQTIASALNLAKRILQ